jgi:hypothetical protein
MPTMMAATTMPSIGPPPHGAPIVPQRPSMAAARPADKDGDGQAVRMAQAGVVALLGISVAQRRLGPSSSARTSTVDRALPSSLV